MLLQVISLNPHGNLIMLKKLLFVLFNVSLLAIAHGASRSSIQKNELAKIQEEIDRLLAERSLALFEARLELSYCLVENGRKPDAEMHSSGFPMACRDEAFVFALYADAKELEEMAKNFKKIYRGTEESFSVEV